jgi:pantoate--beta-alanine ligase
MKTPKIIRTASEMREYRFKNKSKSLGFVPTMGALHEGHLTLLENAKSENDISVLSIFVNPTQFNDKKDLEKYPRTWEQDLVLAMKIGIDVIFVPEVEEMYPDRYSYKLQENDFSKTLCGADRPGHFDGVLTVVMKLFNIVSPTKAYFGEKDFQQLKLIQGMVQAFFLPLEIVPVKTVRESDGLAMSSRNRRLTAAQRQKAPTIFQALSKAETPVRAKEALETAGFDVDYICDYGNRRFAAARLGDIRLIDNVEI